MAYLWKNELLVPGGLDTVRKITYSFIWEGCKGIGWRQNDEKKDKGGIGLKDPRLVVVVHLKQRTN